MAIIYIPFDDLFAFAYQPTYININGYINVGPNTYNVFINYTIQERQQIFQVCEKHLPWQYTQKQEDWERTMYIYQFVIKSPSPFPYPEYPLSKDIIMAILTDTECTYFRHDLHREALDLQQAESPHLTKAQLKAGFQAIEDFWEANRATLKSSMVAAIGQNISNALARKMGKFWLRHKWRIE